MLAPTKAKESKHRAEIAQGLATVTDGWGADDPDPRQSDQRGCDEPVGRPPLPTIAVSPRRAEAARTMGL